MSRGRGRGPNPQPLTLLPPQIFWAPLRNLFIPVFLNCWLAKHALENMIVSPQPHLRTAPRTPAACRPRAGQLPWVPEAGVTRGHVASVTVRQPRLLPVQPKPRPRPGESHPGLSLSRKHSWGGSRSKCK